MKVTVLSLVTALACSSGSAGERSNSKPTPDLGGRRDASVQPPDGSSGTAGGEAGTGGSTAAGGGPGLDAAAGFGGSAGIDGSGGVAGETDTGPSGDSGVAGESGSDAGTSCNVSFQVTTVTYNGRFNPRNIGAVWLMNPENQFVKTLEVWGQARVGNLVNWSAQTLGNRVDAVSSATSPRHRAHESHWDCRDANGNTMPDGQYKLLVEFTEDNSAIAPNPPPRLFSFGFSKGSGSDTVMPQDQPNFIDMVLTIQ